MDFNKQAKILCEGAFVGSNQNFFFVGFTSGQTEYSYVIPPALAVGLRDNLTTHLKQYEEKFGPIDISGNVPLISSPIQKK